ncbi:hypothetical protein B0H13DRAFT_585813 [Mycena leptocephala]|nr:hypothetical protein B0H13DRAFT_585813 [Mycena leptocephala]
MFWFSLVTISLLPGLGLSADSTGPSLGQQQQQLLRDRLFQTNLRGPRWSKCCCVCRTNLNALVPQLEMTIKILLHRWSRIQWILLDWTSIRSITRFIGASWNQADHVFFDVHVFTNIRQLGSPVVVLEHRAHEWDDNWCAHNRILALFGDSGLEGVTAPVLDAGSFGLLPNQDGDPSTLNLTGIPPAGAIIFFDNPSPTHNYSEPGYGLLG